MVYNFEQFKLNELKNVTNELHDDYNGCNLISYKGDYWIIDEDNFDENIDDINKKLDVDENDLHNLITYIREEKPYILVAYINDNKIWLDGHDSFRHSAESTDLKKIKKELKMPVMLIYPTNPDIHSETDELEIDTDVDLNNIKYYHGTSINFLNSILKFGIKPTDSSNYGKIKHDDLVFLTTNLEKAFYHAKNSSYNNKSYPIIIEVRIPDKSKIGLDYDLAIDVLGVDSEEVKELGFDDVYYGSNSMNSIANSTYKDEGFGNLINKIGIISYKGRIPASHIEQIWFDSDNYGDFYYETEIEGINMMDDHEHHIWSNLNPVHLWSELTSSQLKVRMDRIESEYEGDEEFEDDEDYN